MRRDSGSWGATFERGSGRRGIGSRPGIATIAAALELLAVFVGLPLVVALLRLPKLPVLEASALSATAALALDPTFTWRRLVDGTSLRHALRGVALRGLAAAVLIVTIVVVLDRSTLLDLPIHRRELWVRLLWLYPVLSVLPQELLYRVFFFHRYARLFGRGGAMLVASSTAFALLHLVFLNTPAVALGFAAGLVFGRTYARTGSLVVVTLEHTVYGVLVFTLGLGRYFS